MPGCGEKARNGLTGGKLMGDILNDEIKRGLAEGGFTAVLATVGKDGAVHSSFKNTFKLREDGNLVFDEIIETSQTNRNLVYSIWFKKTVSISMLYGNGRCWHITGRPIYAIVAGKEFSSHYTAIRKDLGDVDLSTVWVIEPLEFYEQSLEKRRLEEEAAHPLLKHLDRLTV
jgi:hypothetical protein